MDKYKKIEQLYKKKKDMSVFLADENDYFYLYHLSPIRRNILDWFDFDKDASVLEIGAGVGVITEMLLQKCKTVTACEASERKRDILMKRFKKDDQELEIVSGLKDLTEAGNKGKFDYITMIDNFSIDLVKASASLLSDKGKLIIATENRFAVQTWSIRSSEDMYTLEDITGILETEGLEVSQTYYPVPDHLLPLEIYSEAVTESGSFLVIAEKKDE
jgi:2-polyprenyl-3-methyl-5-hydroxy-6-metoxy-1,4-benzoquinol methylase